MLLNKSHDLVYFDAAKTSCTLENDRIKPKLCDFVFMPHMDVGRLGSIQRYEQKAIAADSQNSGHSGAILSHGFEAASGFVGPANDTADNPRRLQAHQRRKRRRVHRPVGPTC